MTANLKTKQKEDALSDMHPKSQTLLEVHIFYGKSRRENKAYIAEYQRLLSGHNIAQGMSRKGNCMDSGAVENFFRRLKVKMFYGEKFESVNTFIDKLIEYIYYYNNERISTKLKGMSPVQYRTHSLSI